MYDYLLYTLIAFLLSLLFSIGGTGSGIALIPMLNFFGLEFIVAKAIGLFAGASTTIAGGYTGDYFIYFKLNQMKTKKLMGIILYVLAFKMLYKLID